MPLRRRKKFESKFHKGDKFTIEIAEVHTHYDDKGQPYSIYRVKGFSSLVFDNRGLEILQRVQEEENNTEEEVKEDGLE